MTYKLLLIVFSSFLIIGGLVPLLHASDSKHQPQQISDLSTCTRAALRTNPGIQVTRYRISAAQALLNEAWVSPFFQFDATTSIGSAPETRGTSVVTKENSQLPLSNQWLPVLKAEIRGAIPIWTFGKLDSAREAARAGIRAAEAERAYSKANLIFDVRRAYFSLQIALDIEQMISEGRGKLNKAVERLESRIAADDPNVSIFDKYRLSSTLAEVEARSSEANKLASSATAALQVLTSIEPIKVPDCPLSALDFTPKPLQTYKTLARNYRPEVGRIRAAEAAAEANLNAIDAKYFPDLALVLQASTSHSTGTTDQINPFVPDPLNYQSLVTALVAKWSLDFWGNAYRAQRAKQQVLETKAGLEQAFEGISIEVATTYAAVIDANRRVVAWGQCHRDTRRWFISAAQADEVGVVEPKDLVDAVKAYFKARYEHLQSIYDQHIAIARLEKAIGTEILTETQWNYTCE